MPDTATLPPAASPRHTTWADEVPTRSTQRPQAVAKVGRCRCHWSAGLPQVESVGCRMPPSLKPNCRVLPCGTLLSSDAYFCSGQ